MKSRISCLLATTALLLAQPVSARAQQAADEDLPHAVPADEMSGVVDLGTITITANQTETALERSGATVEVLPAEEVADAPTARLGDFLAFQPGVSASANGPLGTQSTVRIRGLGGAYVPVLIDGIDVTDPASSGGGFDFGGLTNAGLGRIEVLKGSQSARFGLNAVGGVINIQSLRPTEDGVHGFAEVEVGRYDFRRGVLGLTARTARTDLSFSTSRIETDGFSASAVGTEADGFDSTQANLYLRHQITDRFAAGLSALFIDSRAEFDEGAFAGDGPPPFDEFTENKAYGLRAFAELTTGSFNHEVSLSYFERNRMTFQTDTFSTPPNRINFAVFPFKGERRRIEYRGSYDPGGIWTFNFGTDYTEEEDLSRKVDIIGAQAELLIAPTDALDLAFSVRNDDHSDFSAEWSARAALAWRMREDLILRASASDGFRAPTLFQLDPFLGNPGFQPESSTSYELGIEKLFGADGFVRATLFQTDIDGQIFFDPGSTRCDSAVLSGRFGCFETGDFNGKGIELSGQMEINDFLTFTGAYTYTDAEQNGSRAVRVPRHDVALGLGAKITPGFTADFTLQHIADVEPLAGSAPVNKVGDYTLVGARFEYDLTDRAMIYLRAENLLDEDYETAGGFNTAGRSAHVGISAKF